MAAAWRAAGHEVQVLADTGATPAPADGMLVQYVPFLYGRRGLSRAPERLIRAARAHGTRVVLFVHEPWVPPTRLPWLLLSPLQRRQLRRLVRLADVTVTAVPAWQRQLGPAVEVHYVGSTLGPPPEDVGAPLPAPAVFSPFASGLAWDWILAAVERINADPPLTVLGTDRAGLAGFTPLRSADMRRWDVRGRLGGADTLALLAAAPLVLAPFVDGLTGRRTSAAAALSAGARVVTSLGPLADATLLAGGGDWPTSRSNCASLAFALWHRPDDAGARAQRMRWYQIHLDPAALDARMARYLLEGA